MFPMKLYARSVHLFKLISQKNKFNIECKPLSLVTPMIGRPQASRYQKISRVGSSQEEKV